MITHSSYPDIINLLKRAEGDLKSIITMMEKGCGFLDITQQLQAVESAVRNANRELVHDHIDHCLELMVREDAQSADDISQDQ